MAIIYPLSLPATNSISDIRLSAMNAIAYSRSPFTFTGQAHAYAGEMWSADITLKAMRETDAEKWSAWLTALRGQLGTFLLGNPFRNSPRGTTTAATITGSAGDRSVTVAKTGTLLAGDYFQLGTTTSSRLYKVLEDSNGSGTLEIWPALRATVSGVSADLTAPVGSFRLSSNEASWSVNNLAIYGITFGAVEAI